MDTATLQVIVFGSIVLLVTIVFALLAAREGAARKRDTDRHTLL